MNEENSQLFRSICFHAALVVAGFEHAFVASSATAGSNSRPPAPVFVDARFGHKPFISRNTFQRKDYTDNHWYRMISNRDHHNTRTINGRDFRNNFRIPATFFDNIVQWYRDNGWASENTDAFLRQPVPLVCKLLASFEMLGRGVPAAVPAQLIGCSQEILREFYKEFLFNVATNLNSYIRFPQTPEEVRYCTETYAGENLPGCMGSIDCVHVPWPKAIASLRSWYVGKEGVPTIAFQVIVDHSRRILSVSQPHPGSLNDKTIATMDSNLYAVRTLPLFTNYLWQARTAGSTNETMRGVYLICDGGYHFWRILQRCSVVSSNPRILHLVNRISSARKDVECTFGILKSRFRSLKVPILFNEVSHVKNLFLTCCIFHNMLLDHDGNEFDGRLIASDFRTSRIQISPETDFSGVRPPPPGYWLGSSSEATHVQLRSTLADHLYFFHHPNAGAVAPSTPHSTTNSTEEAVSTPLTVRRL
jgi:hypothetical protein